MTRRFLLVVTLLAQTLSSGRAVALDPGKPLASCTVDVWGVRNGLPGWVRAIAQTAEGYLWIGTNLGLYRYGGGPVVGLRPPRSLDRASDIMGLLVARDGTLWITPGRGDPICVRDDVMTECWPSGQHLPPGTRIADLEEDAGGGIWIATADGLFRFAGGRLALAHPMAELPFRRINAVRVDGRGRLWIGADDGLYLERAGSFVQQTETKGVAVSSLFPSAAGRLWAASDRGLIEIAGDRTIVIDASVGLPRARPSGMVEDRDGNVWLAGPDGLVRYEPARGFVHFGRQDGIPDEDVTAVFEDREGSLWVGTRGGGAAQLTDRTLDGETGPPSLRQRSINVVAEDAAGTLWVGSRGGLVRWRWKEGQERTYTARDGLPDDEVLTVLPGRDGALWVGTAHGLARFRDGRGQRVGDFAGAVTALALDDAGAPWVGTARGLGRLDGDRVVLVPAADGVDEGEIRSIQSDDQGTLWMSAGGKLLVLQAGRVVRPELPGPRIGRVRSLYHDDDGTLWLATYDGLVRRSHGVWRAFGEAEGLGPGDIYELVADDRGFLWAGASYGVFRISKRSLVEVAQGRRARAEVMSFDESDQRRAVGATRAHQTAAWRGAGGRLWFATSRGVVSADPHRLSVDDLPPPVRIEDAFVDGRPARRGADNAFPPGSGRLEFHFAGITLIEPWKALHRYRLEGFETAWVDAGNRRAAYYTNIPPGNYRFRVQASNADGVWNEAGDSLSFSLAAHFYRTRWFYGVVLLAALGVVLAIHRLRVKQVHGRYAVIFAERSRMARELHDSLLQGMAAAVMHLRGLRKRVGRDGATQGHVAGALADVESLMASNVEEARRLVWDLRAPSDDAAALAPALAATVRRAAHGVSADVRFAVEGAETPLAPDIRHALLRIAQEALHNALAHAGAARIEVRLAFRDPAVVLWVSDDGRGFDPASAPAAQAGHFGLTGMRERASALGAFSLRSRPGQGTTVEVVVDRRDASDA